MYRGAVHKNNPDNVYIRLLSGLEKICKIYAFGESGLDSLFLRALRDSRILWNASWITGLEKTWFSSAPINIIYIQE